MRIKMFEVSGRGNRTTTGTGRNMHKYTGYQIAGWVWETAAALK